MKLGGSSSRPIRSAEKGANTFFAISRVPTTWGKYGSKATRPPIGSMIGRTTSRMARCSSATASGVWLRGSAASNRGE